MNEVFGILAWKGCLIRMNDKWARIVRLANKMEPAVNGESILDTLKDLAGYSLLCIISVEDAIGNRRKSYLNRNIGGGRHVTIEKEGVINVGNQAKILSDDPNKPARGHVLAHAYTYRVYIRKAKGGIRVATVIDSPYIPESRIFCNYVKELIELYPKI